MEGNDDNYKNEMNDNNDMDIDNNDDDDNKENKNNNNNSNNNNNIPQETNARELFTRDAYRNRLSRINLAKPLMPKCAYVPFGIANLGVTCYFSTALQLGLFKHSPEFFRYRPNMAGKSQLKLKDKKAALCHISKLTKMIHNYGDAKVVTRRTPTIEVGELFDALKPFIKEISNMEFSEKIQQDVNEFLKVFIEVVVNITGEESFGEQYTTVMESTIKCMMCEHLSTKTQLYTFLPLYIEMSHQNKVISSLEEYLNHSTLFEHIGDLYKCEQCNTLGRCMRRTLFKKLPNKLIFQLNRFAYDKEKGAIKLHRHVSFPLENFDLKPYLEDSVISGYGNTKYDLVGVFVHLGDTPNNGHYYAYRYDQGFWHLLDDTRVYQVLPEHVASDQAYTLIYEKQQ